jgi:hypothetical protein
MDILREWPAERKEPAGGQQQEGGCISRDRQNSIIGLNLYGAVTRFFGVENRLSSMFWINEHDAWNYKRFPKGY